MLLNAFDIDTRTGERSLELRVGDFPQLEINADLLVVSAFEGCYAPTSGTLLGRLHEAYGLNINKLIRAVDLTNSPLKSWISEPIDLHSISSNQGLKTNQSHFQRIAVIEGTLEWEEGDLLPWPPFNRLFSLLAMLPMRGINFQVVASPLLGSGNQGMEQLAHLPELLEAYREGFRHVPELQRLILFDKSDHALKLLGESIDTWLGRPYSQTTRFELPQELPGLERLNGLLNELKRDQYSDNLSLNHDLEELLTLLRSEEISPIALGMHSRRVVEQLVLQTLGPSGIASNLSLYSGINELRRQGVDPWVISCLHQVRVFGNWMGHPQGNERKRNVEIHDVLAMLSALQRVLSEFPWVIT